MSSFARLSPKNRTRLERLKSNEIDLQIESCDLGDEINTRIARWCVVNSLLQKTRRLIAYLEGLA